VTLWFIFDLFIPLCIILKAFSRYFCSVQRLEKVEYISTTHLMAAAGNAGPRSKPSAKLVSLAGQKRSEIRGEKIETGCVLMPKC